MLLEDAPSAQIFGTINRITPDLATLLDVGHSQDNATIAYSIWRLQMQNIQNQFKAYKKYD